MTLAKAKHAMIPKLRFPEFRGDGGWKLETGKSLFRQISDKDHNGDLPVLAITQEHGAIPRDLIDYHVTVSSKSVLGYKIVRPGDFIISLRSFQGGIEYSDYKGLCSPAYVILREKKDTVADYFRHIFKSQTFIRELTKNLEGLRDGKMISYKQFCDVSINLPKKEEQQKIADCLGSLDDLIAAHSAKLDALQDHKKGLLQKLFPAEGQTTPELRFPGFEGEWGEKKLIKYFPKIRNGFVGTASPFYVSNGIPYLQGKNIKKGKIDDSGLIFISQAFHEKQNKSQLKADDILMVQSGHVGECAVVGEDFQGGNCHALIVLTPTKNTSSQFFKHFFYSPSGRALIDKVKTGNTIAHILSTDLRKMNVCIPEPLEQQKIAECLSELDEQIEAQTKQIAALKEHKQGLMQQLFPNPEGSAA